MSKVVEGRLPCPNCSSSDAFHLYDDGHGYCFSCQFYQKGEKEEFEPVSVEYTYEYLEQRGINKDTFRFYDVKTKIDATGKPVAIGFKYPNGAYKIRNFEKKEFHTEKAKDGSDISKAGLFGRDKFSNGSHKYVTITEGEFDALSLYQAIRSPVVSVQSGSSGHRDCVHDLAFLNSFERVYLALDGDAVGREAASRIAQLFDFNKVYLVKFDKRKDANEYLKNGEEEELRNLWWNAKRYQPENVVSDLQAFKEILSVEPKPGVPYPFKQLTDMTYGIRTGESVLITAQEKVGKTELMHFIEHQLLKETDDAIGAIFLEEPKQRHLQALAGIELKRPVHLPDSGVSSSDVYSAVERLVRQDDRLHIYSHFGSDSPDVLLDTIRFLVSARNCRYILLDHITMAVSGLAGEDERRALDYLSTRLEMMVKELDFALLIVSHVNDDGKTRGSRNIAKVCDIRIDATRDLQAEDPEERKSIYLNLALNRYSSITGPAGRLIFDLQTYSFREESAAGFDAPVSSNDNQPIEIAAA